MDFEGIEGLSYVPGFLAGQQADEVCRALDAGDWDTVLKRRVQHFGYRYDYRARTVPDDARLGALPDWLGTLARRLVDEGHFGAPEYQEIGRAHV